jgi:YD repeat-containing protein
VQIEYYPGKGAPSWNVNTSARIWWIRDVRTAGASPVYTFTYNSDSTPRLMGISNSIGTSENYSFSYTVSQTLYAPFAPQTAFGAAKMLQTATRTGLNQAHTFEYGTNGAGEMSRVVLPGAAELRWTHADFTYAGNRTYREVVSRQMVKQAGAAAVTYPITRPASDNTLWVHSQATLDDAGGAGQRVWYFNTAPGFAIGLAWKYEQRQMPGQVVKARQEYTSVQDAQGRPYIGTKLATIDPGWNQKQSKTEQTLDVFGNVTQTKLYAFGNLVTPARTYTNTYLTTGAYAQYHVNNRLLTSQVSDGAASVGLVTNTYDTGTALDTPTTPGYWNSAHAGPAGRVTRAVMPGGARNLEYYKTGNVAKASDDYGHSVDTTPSQSANYARPGQVRPNNDANLAENYTWNTAFLGLTQESGPNGATGTVSYDAYARPQSTTSADGAVTNYTYTTTPPAVTATTNGHWVKTTYDGFGRAIKVERGDGGGTKSVVDSEYEPCACSPIGKLKRVSQPYAPGGTVYWTVYSYDAVGRTVSVTHPDNSGTTSYAYVGNTVTVTDPAGKWKKYERDAFGNVTKTTEPNPAGGANLETTFAYNLVDQMTQVDMIRGGVTQTRTLVYNMGTLRLSSETHPESGTTSYQYNADGSLSQKTLANGKSVQYSYDALGRTLAVWNWAANGCGNTFF